MAIRVEHQPSPYAVGLAAFATGYGGAKQRQQKYGMDLMAQDQMIRQQNNRLKYMDDARLRERQWQIQDDAAAVKADQDAATLKWERETEAEATKQNRDYWRAKGKSLTPIPDYATPEQKKELAKRAKAIDDLYSGEYDMGDGTDIEEAERMRQEYEAEVGAMKPPSNAEMVKRDRYYQDETTGEVFDEPGPGRVPYSKSTGKRAIETDPAQAKQQDAAQKDYDKKMAEHVKERDRIEKDKLDEWKLANPGVPISARTRAEIRRDATAEAEGLGATIPQAPTAPAAAGAPAAPGAAPAAPAAPPAKPQVILGPDGKPIVPAENPAPADMMDYPVDSNTVVNQDGTVSPYQGVPAPVPTLPPNVKVPGDKGYVQSALEKAGMGPIPIPPQEAGHANATDAEVNEAVSAASDALQKQRFESAKASRDAALKKRKALASARKAGFGQAQADGVQVVRTKAEYEALKAAGMLPSGTVYFGPDGEMRRVN